ncbi:MAG: ABC transporter ATP-binding protein [SAR202 cluster bacterium]|nr:ABC transporter ATP-binding protein [SAR202 cluster bacterium]
MKVLLRILSMAVNHKVWLAGAYFCMIGGAASSLLLPHLFGDAIDEFALILETGVFTNAVLVRMALAILATSVVIGLMGFGQSFFAQSLSEATVYDIRNNFFDRVQRLSFAFHDKQHTGNLMSRAISDVESMRVFVYIGLVELPWLVLVFTATGVLMVMVNWKLGLVAVTIMPIIGAISIVIRGKIRGTWNEIMEYMSRLSTVLQENLTGVRVVKAFGIERFEQAKYDVHNTDVRKRYFRLSKLQASNNTMVGTTYFSGMGLTLLFGGYMVVNGEMTAGQLAQFLFYLQILMGPIWSIGGQVNAVARALPAGQRLFEILDTKSAVVEREKPLEPQRTRGAVRYEGVNFSYKAGTPVLKNVGIAAAPGQVIALVGAPGSGKSTIVNLMPRFYDVDSGRITIDDIDIKDVSLKSLRRNIGIVQQDVFLFGTTIRENIAYGREDATLEEVIAAAKVAQLHEHIASLPAGYETELGERGSTLSGGQRQRLSIARAVLLDPPILILDDSTSSVDAHTEEQIRTAMEAVMKGRTTFVIANRLGTVHRADQILVLKDGQITERGTHMELLAKGGIYKDIYDLQLRPQEEVLHEFDVNTPSALQEAK